MPIVGIHADTLHTNIHYKKVSLYVEYELCFGPVHTGNE